MRPSARLPAELIRLVSLDPASIESLASSRYPVLRAKAGNGRPVVLRLFPWKGAWTSRSAAVVHVAWEHDFLAVLSASGFPAPQPQRLFAGRSWHCTEEGVWAALSYLPGEPLSWRRSPGMFEAGAFLAQYHRAAAKVVTEAQRPLVVGFDELRRVAPWPTLRRLAPDSRAPERLRAMVEAFDAELRAATTGAPQDRLVIHGDFTNANILVSDDGRRISGVIDFGLSQLAPAAADVAAALWRSGRPDPVADELDPRRVHEFVSGYLSVRTLGSTPQRSVLLYLIGRGLQRVVRGALRDDPDCYQPLPQLTWVIGARRTLEKAVEDA